MQLPRLTLVCLCLAASGASVGSAADGLVGRSIDDFQLEDWQGQPYQFSEKTGENATVVAFLGIECPLAKAYAPRLAALEQKYASRGVAVVAIDSNEQDSLSEMGQFARANNYQFPLLKDPGQRVADQFGAERTPEFFVLDAKRVVRYHGRFDDQYGVGLQRPEVTRRDLELALSDVLAKREVLVPETAAPGCLIGRLREARDDAPVTWSNQIVRIMQRHCQECHRPNEIGPFALIDYEEAAGWAGMIAEVVADGRMPPWHASPEHGEFSNDARLSEEEKELIARWVADGAPEGDRSQLPPLREFNTGWGIGEPDVVLYNVEEPEQIPATGVVDYRYYVIDPKFDRDVWISGVEVRPTNTSVVHHVAVYAQSPGDSWTDAFRHVLGGYQPGGDSNSLPEGIAIYLPAGSRLVFQTHYTPNGTPQDVRIAIGLKLSDPAEVRRRFFMLLVKNQTFLIPPSAKNFPVEASVELGHDVELVALVPHLHLRGQEFRYEARYPDGTEEILLDVPKWDFNWQHAYVLKRPKLLPEGTRVRCLAHYDNSADNPANPDPRLSVEFGHQITDEMMDGYLAVTVPVDPAALSAASVRPPLDQPAVKTGAIEPPKAPRWPWYALAVIPVIAGGVAAFERFRRAESPTPATSPSRSRWPRVGDWCFALLVLMGLLLPGWVLIETDRAMARGWRPGDPSDYWQVVYLAWVLLLATWAVLLIPPLRRVIHRHAGAIASLCLVLGMVFLCAEWAWSTAGNTGADHLHPPGHTMTRGFGPGSFSGSVKTAQAHYNAEGIRAGEMPPAESAERILCLGGSTTETPYLSDADTWTSALEAQLNQRGGRTVWVGNAGKTDCTTADHLRFLESWPLAPSMDLIVCMVGSDDLWHTLTERVIEEPVPPAWRSSHVADALLDEATSSTADKEPNAIDDASFAAYWDRRNDVTFPPPPKQPPDFDRAIAEYRDRLRRLADWGQRHGVRMVFMTQPTIWSPDLSLAARKRQMLAQTTPLAKEWNFLTSDNLRPLFARYNQAVKDVCRESNVECLDLAAELNGQEFFFEDDFHFNAEGCRRAARFIANRLGQGEAAANLGSRPRAVDAP